MAQNGPDSSPPQYTPDQSQYIPPLESWPPQAPQTHGYQATQEYGAPQQYSNQPFMQDYNQGYAPPAPPEQPSVTLPWIFVALGFFIPLSALIVGVWALTRTHSDSRYTWIAFAGFGMFVFSIFVGITYGL